MIKNLPANTGATGDAGLIPGLGDADFTLGGEEPLEEGIATHSRLLLGESHGQRSLVGSNPWGCKELDVTEAT